MWWSPQKVQRRHLVKYSQRTFLVSDWFSKLYSGIFSLLLAFGNLSSRSLDSDWFSGIFPWPWNIFGEMLKNFLVSDWFSGIYPEMSLLLIYFRRSVPRFFRFWLVFGDLSGVLELKSFQSLSLRLGKISSSLTIISGRSAIHLVLGEVIGFQCVRREPSFVIGQLFFASDWPLTSHLINFSEFIVRFPRFWLVFEDLSGALRCEKVLFSKMSDGAASK
mgnify:CR=1 FL=1